MRATRIYCAFTVFASISATGCAPEKPKPVVQVTAKPKMPWADGTSLTQNFAIPVLMYHRIDHLTKGELRSPLLRDLTVSPEDFEDQVKYLVDNGYTILSVYDVQTALLEGTELPEKAVAITMDDGYRDNFDKAFPILRKYGVPATVFVVTSVVGDSKHLTWPQMQTMHAEGVRYGSHTVTHPDLTLLGDSVLDRELGDSKAKLEAQVEPACTTLAYPAGSFNDRVVEHTKVAGYLTAWNKGGGPVRPGNDAFRLPRVRVQGTTTIEDFIRKVSSGYWTLRIEREEVEKIKDSRTRPS